MWYYYVLLSFLWAKVHTWIHTVYFKLFTKVAAAPTKLEAVQVNSTSVHIHWIPPSPLNSTTGYNIYYYVEDRVSEGNLITVNNASADSFVLTGLQSGVKYTISLVATSQHLTSNPISTSLQLLSGESVRYKFMIINIYCTAPYLIQRPIKSLIFVAFVWQVISHVIRTHKLCEF